MPKGYIKGPKIQDPSTRQFHILLSWRGLRKYIYETLPFAENLHSLPLDILSSAIYKILFGKRYTFTVDVGIILDVRNEVSKYFHQFYTLSVKSLPDHKIGDVINYVRTCRRHGTARRFIYYRYKYYTMVCIS